MVTAPWGPIAPELIWLVAIQYYGEEKISGGKFEFLVDVFDVLLRIDPLFDHAYQFGSIVIADEGKNPEQAIGILKRGLVKNPSSWIPPFYTGFIYYIHKYDFVKAGKYFDWATRYHNVPKYVYRLAAFAYKKGKLHDAAILTWKKIYEYTENQVLKEAALRNIKYLLIEKHLDYLNDRLNKFEQSHGRKPISLSELIPGYIDSIPPEPFGGSYQYDPRGDSFVSTTYLQLQEVIAYLNKALRKFRVRYGGYPERLDELVAKGIIESIPPHPLGRFYCYQQGKVQW